MHLIEELEALRDVKVLTYLDIPSSISFYFTLTKAAYVVVLHST